MKAAETAKKKSSTFFDQAKKSDNNDYERTGLTKFSWRKKEKTKFSKEKLVTRERRCRIPYRRVRGNLSESGSRDDSGVSWVDARTYRARADWRKIPSRQYSGPFHLRLRCQCLWRTRKRVFLASEMSVATEWPRIGRFRFRNRTRWRNGSRSEPGCSGGTRA